MNITEKDIINKLKEIEPEYFNNFKFDYNILYEGKLVKATPEFFASIALKVLTVKQSNKNNNNNNKDDLIAQGIFFTYLYTIKGKMALELPEFPKISVKDSVRTYYFYPSALGSIKYSVNKIFSDDYGDPYSFTIYCEIEDFYDEYSLISIRYYQSDVARSLYSYAVEYADELKKQKDFKVSEYFIDRVPDSFNVGLEKIGHTPFKPGDWCCLCANPVSASHITYKALSNAFYADNLVYASYGSKFKSSKDDLKDFKGAILKLKSGVKIFED